MSTQQFTDGVISLLGSEPTFVAALTALLGTAPKPVIKSNIPAAQIPTDALPCFVIEQGDGAPHANTEGSDATLTIGMSEQQVQATLALALLWNNDDRDAAFEQRTQLPDLLTQLFLRNPMPGGITGAWVSSWQPDRAVNHPLQFWRFEITGMYSIYNV